MTVRALGLTIYVEGVLTVRELGVIIYRMFCQGTGHDNI